jgi:hypothetical protein
MKTNSKPWLNLHSINTSTPKKITTRFIEKTLEAENPLYRFFIRHVSHTNRK